MSHLATFINPAIDTGERFAEEIVDIVDEPVDAPYQINVDDEPLLRLPSINETGDCWMENKRQILKKGEFLKTVIAAAYEAGREQGRKER